VHYFSTIFLSKCCRYFTLFSYFLHCSYVCDCVSLYTCLRFRKQVHVSKFKLYSKSISIAFRDFPAKDSRTNHRLLTVFYQRVFVVFAELENIQCQSKIVSLHFSDYFLREFPCFYFEFSRFSLASHFPPRLSPTINLTNLMISSRNLIKIGKCYLFDDFS
jgi:hypothetical protein